MNHFTVGVPEGIGDIIWVYRKVKPYCDTMGLVITHELAEAADQYNRTIQNRSTELALCLPGVNQVRHVYSHKPWCKDEVRLAKVFEMGANQFDFTCNGFLEKGIKLEDIDSGMKVAWGLGLAEQPTYFEWKDILNSNTNRTKLLLPGSYLLVYISEYSRRNGSGMRIWTPSEWAWLLINLDFDGPIVLTGANFDKGVLWEVADNLRSKGQEALLSIGKPGPELFWTLHNCKHFIGYQSGLNILADEFCRPQDMIYFESLREMKDSWVKPCNRGNGIFNYHYFDEGPDAVLEKLKGRLR